MKTNYPDYDYTCECGFKAYSFEVDKRDHHRKTCPIEKSRIEATESPNEAKSGCLKNFAVVMSVVVAILGGFIHLCIFNGDSTWFSFWLLLPLITMLICYGVKGTIIFLIECTFGGLADATQDNLKASHDAQQISLTQSHLSLFNSSSGKDIFGQHK